LPSLEDSRTITDSVTEALVTYVDAPKK